MSDRESRLSRERYDLKKKLAKANDLIEDLENENNELRNKVKCLNKENLQLHSKLKTTESSVSSLEKTLANTKDTIQILRVRKKEYDEYIDQKETKHFQEMTSKQNEIAALSKEIEKFKEDFEVSCSELAQHNQLLLEFNELSKKYESIISERSTAQTYLEESHSEFDTSTETVIPHFSHNMVDTSTQTDFSNISISDNSTVNDSGVYVDQNLTSQIYLNEDDNDSQIFPESGKISLISEGKTSTPVKERSFSQNQLACRSYSLKKANYNVNIVSNKKQHFSEVSNSKEKSRRSIEKILRTSPDDRPFILSINKLFNDFILDDLKTLKSPSYNSYERYIVHNMADLHGLSHFLVSDDQPHNKRQIFVTKEEGDAKLPTTHNLQTYLMHRGVYTPFTPARLIVSGN